MTVPVSIQYTAKQGFVIPANCKVMALCDDTVETVTGGNLIIDSGFASPSDWTEYLNGSTGGSTSIATGVLTITQGTNSVWMGRYQSFTTVVGKKYVVYVKRVSSTGSSSSRLSITTSTSISDGTTGIAYETIATEGQYFLRFTATTTTSYVAILSGASSTLVQTFDNLFCAVRVDDISGNESDLLAIGSLTKAVTATNATTVAYSGFGASNYLYQPYNSALDFGTAANNGGIVFKSSGTSGIETLFIRADYTGAVYSGAAILVQITVAGLVVVTVTDDGFSSYDRVTTATAYDDGEYHFASYVINSGYLYFYIDGSLIGSSALTAAAGSLTNTSAVLYVGVTNTGAEPATTCTLAGFRIGTGSRTAAQIKESYDKEKTMFRYGGVYAIDGQTSTIDMSSVASLERRAPENIGETNVAHDGTAWGVTDRIEQGWSVTTDFIEEADRGTWEHFFRSCKTGESFTFDSHGTSAVPVDALTHRLLPGAKLSRVSSTEKFTASFEVVEIDA